MDRIVIVFESEENRARIRGMLESAGFSVVLACRSGAEATRAAKKMHGAIIVCGYKLVDMTADTLAHTLDRVAVVLVVARPAQLELCEQEGIFKLATPLSKGELLASIRMLGQINEKLLSARPSRSAETEELVSRAKEILMDRNHMNEAQAHRFIQKKSMDTGAKLEETARLIIDACE